MRRILVWLVAAASLFVGPNAHAASHILGPPTDDGPVIVNVGFYLSDISDVDEEQETIQFEGIVTMRWKDPRQAFDSDETGYREKFYQGNYQFFEVFDGWWPQLILANEAGRYERQGLMLRIEDDGSMTYVEEIDAIAEARMDLRRLPFDDQDLYARFEVLGFDSSMVVLREDPSTTGKWEDDDHWIHVPQWRPPVVSAAVDAYLPAYGGNTKAPTSVYIFNIEMHRNPGYLMRLVLFPLTMLVVLSWSVFWMSRSTLGDRMDISFIGILTIVAYQITISGLMPKISYATILSTYLLISFITICASVIVNLAVGWIDQLGDYALGDRVDLHCRWIFPLGYVSAIAVTSTWMYWTT
ncbi:MAG: hypothetical protein P8R42_20050 [Candidatus Binatia bacterium]|nr:hypothetical protein [Candidatus Binatia bacterium]